MSVETLADMPPSARDATLGGCCYCTERMSRLATRALVALDRREEIPPTVKRALVSRVRGSAIRWDWHLDLCMPHREALAPVFNACVHARLEAAK